MIHLRGKWIIIWVVLFVALLWVLPNFIDRDLEKDENWWGPVKKIVKGLDIQGGLHLVMGVDVEGVIVERISRLAATLKEELIEEEISVSDVSVSMENKRELVVTATPEELTRVENYLSDYQYAGVLQVLSNDGSSLYLGYYEVKIQEYKKEIVEQAIEVIRNRIDGIGVAEPNISAQGEDRILVQLPGIKNANQAKELIHRTARLNFRVVHKDIPPDSVQSWVEEAETGGNYELGKDPYKRYIDYLKKINEDLSSRLPENTKVVFEKLPGAKDLQAGRRAFLVETDSSLPGDLLERASVRPDEFGKPKVTFDLNVEGRRRFAQLTAKAAGGFLAIVLDDVVKSAPSVEQEINSSSAEINLGGGRRSYEETFSEANFIATSLRAGALPAALEQLEERTVGPTLGQDSIEKGKMAGFIGGLLILVFMLIYYQFLGLVANVALTFNILLILAILSSLGATLTLPGVAGIILTVGMAVDANIIIFERIKEEIRKGATLTSAVQNGFSQALSAIIDANITTAGVCLVLMYFGTGPIRGFAVTLICGIVTSMFTAIFVSRAMIEFFIIRLGVKKIVNARGVA